MEIRTVKPEDAAEIARLLEAQGAKYEMSACEALTIAEEGGVIVVVAGLVPSVEVVAVANPQASPHRRMEALWQLHKPLAEETVRRGAQKAYVFLDPKFRGFRNRLMLLGWERPLWEVLEMPRVTIEGKAKCEL